MFEKIINRGTLMTVIVGVVVVLGIVATFRVPVQMIPDLDVRTVQVRTSWPGATPQDIEKEILIEQEEYLRSIPSNRGNGVLRPGTRRARVPGRCRYQ
jgi:multidrug efflux pump subunit AcrB